MRWESKGFRWASGRQLEDVLLVVKRARKGGCRELISPGGGLFEDGRPLLNVLLPIRRQRVYNGLAVER